MMLAKSATIDEYAAHLTAYAVSVRRPLSAKERDEFAAFLGNVRQKLLVMKDHIASLEAAVATATLPHGECEEVNKTSP